MEATIYRDHVAERHSASDEECWMIWWADGKIDGPWQSRGAAQAAIPVERARRLKRGEIR